MMGYDEDEDFGEGIQDHQIKQLMHDPAMTALTAMPLDGAGEDEQAMELLRKQ